MAEIVQRPGQIRCCNSFAGLRPKVNVCVFLRSVFALTLLFFFLLGPTMTRAQRVGIGSPDGADIQRLYDSAQDYQSKGDIEQASVQYQQFLSSAIAMLAQDNARIGQFTKAEDLFSEALRLSPNSFALQLDFAEAALHAKDYSQASTFAETLIEREPRSSRARVILGSALLELGDGQRAVKEFEAAVAIEPDFVDGDYLARAYLRLKEKDRADRVLQEMSISFGESAEAHMRFGLAYVENGYPTDAIKEFRKAIAENDRLPGTHYSLGASYLLDMGEIDFPLAAAEFKKELEINPDDYLSHAQLGYVELSQHRFADAEADLTRAAELNPIDPDVYLSLGQLFLQIGRPAEAEKVLRKSIELTLDPSHNHYQVQRAHYLLGRILLQSSRAEEGKREMQVSEDLLKQSGSGNHDTAAGTMQRQSQNLPFIRHDTTYAMSDPDAVKNLAALEARVGPAIADSYNNLGAIAAQNKNYAVASSYFQRAASWNPGLEAVDFNWGKAAYAAGDYRQSIAPLSRYLLSHAESVDTRSELATSLFMVHAYAEVIGTLRPIESHLISAPALSFMYADSEVETGEFKLAIVRLKSLTANAPLNSLYHRALGVALARSGAPADAVPELRTALRLDPGSATTRYQLALALVQLKQTSEAETLLTQVAGSEPRNADALFELGKLQLGSGKIKPSIMNLETAVRLNPGTVEIHCELESAYRRDSRFEDATREGQQCRPIQDVNASAQTTPQPQ